MKRSLPYEMIFVVIRPSSIHPLADTEPVQKDGDIVLFQPGDIGLLSGVDMNEFGGGVEGIGSIDVIGIPDPSSFDVGNREGELNEIGGITDVPPALVMVPADSLDLTGDAEDCLGGV